MEAVERVSKMPRDIVRAREPMRGPSHVDASGLEEPERKLKVRLKIVRMKMLQEHAAKRDIRAGVRQAAMVAIVDHDLHI
jgi:hypothetical protein